MTEREYGMIISNLLTKLGLGLPLSKEESSMVYDFIMQQNNCITEALNAVAKLEEEAKSLNRMVSYYKNKNK